MASAVFRINQPGITSPKPPTGQWGRAREDVELFGDGGTIEFEAQDGTALSYKWELISEPPGSSATLVNPTLQTASVDLTVTGGYLIRLIVDEGQPTEDVLVLYAGIALAQSGLPIPAFNELDFDNSQTPYDGGRGWEEKLTNFLKWADANSVGGASPFESGIGTLSAKLKGAGNITSGDYAYAMGLDNIALGDYSHALGREADAYWPAQWAFAGGAQEAGMAGSSQMGMFPVYGETFEVVVGGFSNRISSIGGLTAAAVNPHVLREYTSYACDMLLVARYDNHTAAWMVQFAMRRETTTSELVTTPNYNKFAQIGASSAWDVTVDVNDTDDALEITPFADVANVRWMGQVRFVEIYEDT